MREDILIKVVFVILIAVLILIVMFGKDVMAVINRLVEIQAESLGDQLLR